MEEQSSKGFTNPTEFSYPSVPIPPSGQSLKIWASYRFLLISQVCNRLGEACNLLGPPKAKDNLGEGEKEQQNVSFCL